MASKRATQLLALILVFQAGALHAAEPELKIHHAYRGVENKEKLLVEFEKSPRFPTGNTWFWLSKGKLTQLDVASRSEQKDAAWISFSDGSGPSFDFSSQGAAATLECPNTPLHFSEIDFHGTLPPLQFLSRAEEPIFFLKIDQTEEYIYVTAPHFNFHDNYRVFRGTPGHFRELPLVLRKDFDSYGQSGLIQFKSGGGIYLPTTVNLMQSEQKSPFMIEGAGGKMVPLLAVKRGDPIIRKMPVARSSFAAPKVCQEVLY